jgi:uncharacterized membrane protein
MVHQTTKSIIVGLEAPELYRLWADFENFPRFMKNVRSVTRTGDRTSHWVAIGPLGKNVEWDAEITRLDPDARIAWHSLPGGDIKTSGQVTFHPLPHGQTEITVTFQYVTVGPAGVAVHIFGDADDKIMEDLRSFKAFAEASHAGAYTA